MDPLFPVVPAELAGLDLAELTGLLDTHKELAAKIALASQVGATPEQREVFGTHDATSVVEQFTAAAVEIKRIEAAIAELSQGEEAFAATIAAQAIEAGVVVASGEGEGEGDGDGDDSSGDGDGDGDGDEPEAVSASADGEEVVEVSEIEVEAEAVVASAPVRLRLPSSSSRHQPLQRSGSDGASLVASVGVEGIAPGRELDEMGLASALLAARDMQVSAPPGFSQKAVVASAKFDLPAERRLEGMSYDADWAKIQAVVGKRAMGADFDGNPALVAAGGLCAPVSNYYGLEMISTTLRPVRDSLVGFQATRGGINVAAVPTLVDVTTGVGYRTEEQDAAGGTFAAKTCQAVACPDFDDVKVNIIFHCLQFGNLQARTFPEQVAQFTDLTMAAHARLAEGLLLDGIGAASTAVTSAAVNGAVNSMLGVILQTAAGMRSRHRTTPGLVLRALFPEWLKDLLVLDLIRGQFDRFERNQNGVTALLRSFGIEPSWYLDSASGAGQVFGAQDAGAFLEFPDTAVWYLFPEGSFLFLDGGTLELGIVRDSVLNAQNQFTVFGETFENVAFIGVESLKVTSTICPNGAVALPGTATTC